MHAGIFKSKYCDSVPRNCLTHLCAVKLISPCFQFIDQGTYCCSRNKIRHKKDMKFVSCFKLFDLKYTCSLDIEYRKICCDYF